MAELAVAPYGSWPTPITSEVVVRAAVGLGEVAVADGAVWWSEQRPEEAGRTALVRDGTDVLPAPWNARTAVHEYGGGAWWTAATTVWFTHWDDQRLYRLTPGDQPEAITPAPARRRGDRYADGDVHPDGKSLVCVREHHPPGGRPGDVANEIVGMPAAGGGQVDVLVTGPDFVSDPRWSPDGRRLCWLEWDHPAMPWDGTRLRVGARTVAGGPTESVSQPRWARDGSLWFISDRSGWWNLHRWSDERGVEPAVVVDAEIGVPQWVFGQSRYDLFADGRVVCAVRRAGLDQLAVWDGTALVDLDLGVTFVASVVVHGDDVLFVGASAHAEPELHRVRMEGTTVVDRTVVRAARPLGVDPAWFSRPEPIDYPSTGGRTAHALFHAPTSPTHRGPAGERPPLLVMIHGGPTSAARPLLNLRTQYWTSRGFGVVDVNYRGSTGYGRHYREQLRGQWGIVDVEDCTAAARWLADAGRVDRDRLCITGGSAGGFTALAALARDGTFAAGASHFGVADLEALARDTHKFESRYLDGLVGPYPEARARYVARSPIHQVERFDRPLIVLQGLEDEVVPPSQSQAIVTALGQRGVPVAHVTFPGEQHGFRQAANIRRALDSELSFYAQVLGFELPAAEGIAPVAIDNLP